MESEASIQAPEPPLNFRPEVGMKIFCDHKLNSIPVFLMEIVIAKPDSKITKEEFKNIAGSNNSVCIKENNIIEILEVGQGEQAGLIKVHIHGLFELNEGWINTGHTFGSHKWSIDRRKGGPLQGVRLDEICDPDSKLVIRRTDEVRQLTILAMRKQSEITQQA